MPLISDDTKLNQIFEFYESSPKIFQQEYLKLLEEIIVRCDDGNIKHHSATTSDQDINLAVQIPSGHEVIELPFRDPYHAELFLCIPFEKIRFINGYKAIYSTENNYIEGMLETRQWFGYPPSPLLHRKIKQLSAFGNRKINDEISNEIIFTSNDLYPDLQVSIGPASNSFSVLETIRLNRHFFLPGKIIKPTTIKIEGITIQKHDKVLEILEKITNSCLFKLDLAVGFPMYLARNFSKSSGGQSSKLKGSFEESDCLSLPEFQYDSKPMSLYWYANTLEGISLLQFLAYYQVIEFFFPIFSEKNTINIAKQILKDPTFNRSKDSHLERLLNSLRPYLATNGYGDEPTGLLATIRECVTENSLREFFKENTERFEYFKSKSVDISREKISVDHDKSDIVIEVANRIYDIRCKIVHTKMSTKNNSESLFPFSKEAQQLGFDIELVQFLARKVLIVSGIPFSL